MTRTLIFVGGVVVLVAVLVLFGTGGAWSHSFYSSVCCSERDCAPALPGAVTWTPVGWAVAITDEVVPFDDPRIQYSPPGAPQFHICKQPAVSTIRCLYVPLPDS